MRWSWLAVGAGVAAATAITVATLRLTSSRPLELREGAIPLGVLGDSDSHIYRDPVMGTRRGGPHHAVTFQWTEILDLLRGDEVDQGARGRWGTRGMVARLRDRLGRTARMPPKYDFRYNFALSGARCSSLVSGWSGQARWMANHIRQDPEGWSRGVVVVRIGVNDLAQRSHLEAYARGGLTPEIRAVVRGCVAETAAAVEMILDASPGVRVLLVGIADDTAWPADETEPRSPDELQRMATVLTTYDEALRDLAARQPRVAFAADTDWYRSRWTGRDSTGVARTSAWSLGGSTPITDTRGDHPSHLGLEDGHAGTVANGLWLMDLIRSLNRAFGVGITPLLEAEVADLVDPEGSYGIAPPPSPARTSPTVAIPFDTLTVSIGELPLVIPPVHATADDGRDVTPTATGWLRTREGDALPLFGDGDRLELRAGRHPPGTYRLEVRVRDRGGRMGRGDAVVVIRSGRRQDPGSDGVLSRR